MLANLLLSCLAVSSVQASIGSWENIGSSGVVCIHTALLPKSKLLCMERPHEPPFPANPNAYPYTTAEINLMDQVQSNDKWTTKYTIRPLSVNPFCGGHSMMANGSIFVAGGDANTAFDPATNNLVVSNGLQGRRVYVPCNGKDCQGTWSVLPAMSSARWYPTLATLPDGRIIIIGGTTNSLDFANLGGNNNPTYEYWPPKEDGSWPRHLDLLAWAYPWCLYPITFVMPSGNVFVLASNKTTIINPITDELNFSIPDMPALDHLPWIYPNTPTATVMPMTLANNWTFTVQVCGGSRTTLDGSQVCIQISPEAPNPRWTRVDDIPVGRVMPDSVLLPDGTVLYVNGAKWGIAGGQGGDVRNAVNPAMEAHIFNPAAPSGSQWTNVATAKNYRLYHSGAILLETGHVVTTGSEMNNYDDFWPEATRRPQCYPAGTEVCRDPYNTNIERFTPPYLEMAALYGRPVIKSAPETLTYGSTFRVHITGELCQASRVTFIRYSVTTHSTNTDQRFIELRILASSDDFIVVEAPPNGGIAPPGNWFLFVLDSRGVPSIAKTINLQNGPATSVPVPNSVCGKSTSQAASSWSPMILTLVAGSVALRFLVTRLF